MRRVTLGLFVAGCIALVASVPRAAETPSPGPATEKRFPPLVLPTGFKATLFACDPLIEYPSVIAAGPRPGTLFVAVDYLTGLGTDIVRRDEVRLVEDIDGDGYADRATVFATGLNSIQGLAYHDGRLFVMHAPYLSVLRDTKGTGKANDRHDLLKGIGLAPEVDQIRLHNANGVVVGHDGWLYLAVGDRGANVVRPEGDRLVLKGGGILRCRPDGRDLHVFATGLRNIYDIALDAELNVFVRDNENDGGDYKVRVCHSFFGADHGYPYLFAERPDEALAPLADLGLGSSAGGVCYLEAQFPAEYRGGLFFCEWGRAVVRYPLRASGASFVTPKEIFFADGAATDPYGFKPTDLVVGADGSLFISDWADGQRPRRGRGRIYQVRHVDKKSEPRRAPALPREMDDLIARLNSASHAERCQAQGVLEQRGKEGMEALIEALKSGSLATMGRLHGTWAMVKIDGARAAERLIALARDDTEASVQAQAVRALADVSDPVLLRHRLDAGPGDAALAERLAALAVGRSPRVQLDVLLALGRLRWSGTAAWVGKNLSKPDTALAHAAQMALRRAGNWQAVLALLDGPAGTPIRAIALRAVAGQHETQVVDGLVERMAKEMKGARLLEYADALARVHKKAGPRPYWGFRPAPRPANEVTWERTAVIDEALDRALSSDQREVRLGVLRAMLREKVPARTATLGGLLRGEHEPTSVGLVLAALRASPPREAWRLAEGVVRDREQTTANRLLAVRLFLDALDVGSSDHLQAIVSAVEDGPVLASLLEGIGKRKAGAARSVVLGKATSPDAQVRAAAVTAIAALELSQAPGPVRKLLDDRDPRVRSAAVCAAGKLGLTSAASRLLELAADRDPEVRRSSLEALRRLREPRAVPVGIAALQDRDTSLEAVACLAEIGGPEHATVVVEVVRRQPSVEVLSAVRLALVGWASRTGLGSADRIRIEDAVARLHGNSGVFVAWHVRGPVPAAGADVLAKLKEGLSLPTGPDPVAGWRLCTGSADGRVQLGIQKNEGNWLGYAEAWMAEPTKIELACAASAPLALWVNGRKAYQRDQPTLAGPYPEPFDASLDKGINRILVRLSARDGLAELSLRFRRKNASVDQERFAQAALARAGNPERGRQLFFNADKSQCVRCHRVGDQGERVGPELTALGARFAKVYIVESILEPSRTIAPSFESTAIDLKSGKVLIGIKVAESDTTLTLVDSQAQKHVIPKADIEEQRKSAVSAMPEGLEKRFTEDEFVDLVSFLSNLKEARGP